MTTDVIKKLLNDCYLFFNGRYSADELKIITKELNDLINFDFQDFCIENKKTITYEEIQNKLSKLNEKNAKQKKNGVYYTPNDLVKFIYTNTIKAYYGIANANNLHVLDLNGVPYNSFCFEKNIFDPTCGTGEFLIDALSTKFDLLDLHNNHLSSKDIIKTIKTIYGNDINPESCIIAIVRIYIYVLNRYGVEKSKGICLQLKQNFYSYDFINYKNEINKKFDILIGNPPYVEDSKCETIPEIKYGNVYANVLRNSVNVLENNGVMGFVIPLSYVATPRMSKIREVINLNFNEQYVLSYCDRPDCLFTGVHQKLCILIAHKKIGSNTNNVYTSAYNFWYKEERTLLFDRTKTVLNQNVEEKYIPKLGTDIDVSIYNKVISFSKKLSDELVYPSNNLYLNMRAAFWIKAFLGEHCTGEYKCFGTESVAMKYYIYCVLNSSLFWWYWICCSDCWHITNKELKGFSIPTPNFDEEFVKKCKILAKTMESKLEKTKKYVGTKQTEYEYKHRECINEIHSIDDFVNELYGLTEEESLYIKNFAYTYRVSGGVL